MRIAILLLLLTACTKDFILEEKTKILEHENYYSALATGYKELARRERAEFDWFDTEYFAKKGIEALNHNLTMPEHPENRDIQNKFLQEELIIARKSLINLLIEQDFEVRYHFPLRSARLQILYEYWLEQVEENWQYEEISKYRDEFWASFDSLIAAAKLTKIKELEAIIAKKYFTLYFAPNKFTLDKLANKELTKLKYRIRNTLNDYLIILENYTNLEDTKENRNLLQRRQDKVKRFLFANGVMESKIYKEELIFLDRKNEINSTKESRNRIEIYIIDKKL